MPYLSVKENDIRSINQYFEACEKEGVPFVYCATAITLATVAFDCASLPREKWILLDDRFERLGKGAQAIAARAVDGLPRRRARYQYSSTYVEIKNIRRERGEAAAEALDALIRELITE